MHIVIVGGGIGGIGAALSCLKAGIDVTVLEQASVLREIGAGVQISSNGTLVLRSLGLLDAVEQVAIKPLSMRMSMFETGEEISDWPLGDAVAGRYGNPFLQVHRADLLKVLADALPPGVLRTASRVESFRQDDNGVTVTLASGEELRADAIVGADGIHSVICQQLFGASEQSFSGNVAWRALIPAARIAECGFEHRFYGWTGPGRTVFSYWVRPDELYNFGGVVPSSEVVGEAWSQAGDISQLRASFDGACPQLARLVEGIDSAFITGLYYKDPLTTWTVNRATLLGDSAHAMLPYMAQGACQALEDGVVLASCLRRHGAAQVPLALLDYEHRRLSRVTKVQSRARAAGSSYTERDPLKIRARNGTMRGLRQIDPFATTTWGWVYGYDASKAGETVTETPEPVDERQPLDDGSAEARAWDLWTGIFSPEDQARGIPGMREGYERLWAQFSPSPGATIRRVETSAMKAELVTPAGCAQTPVVLHIHGGGFAFGSAKSSLEYAERLATAVGGKALVLDYQLAPEHPYPVALTEARAAYTWLLESGVAAKDIFLSGESAGAGLAVVLGMVLRDDGAPPPAGFIALSPLVDLSLTGESIDSLAGSDPVIDRDSLTAMAAAYFQAEKPDDWRISPLFGKFEGLPPLLIQAGSREVLVSDSTRLAERARAAGCDVTLEMQDERLHVFSLFPFLPAAETALNQVKAFAQRCRPAKVG
jgi:salicylate hydroxylase